MKTRTYEKKSVRTTVLIDAVDWDFIQEKSFKPTNLLRIKIKELMEKDKIPVAEIEATNKRLVEHRDNLLKFIKKKKLMKEYMENAS